MSDDEHMALIAAGDALREGIQKAFTEATKLLHPDTNPDKLAEYANDNISNFHWYY